MKIITLIICSFIVVTYPAFAQFPPPPPGPEITVTDSVSPIDDLNIPNGVVTTGSSATRTITVTNDGNSSLAVGNIAVNDPLVFPYSVIDDNCSGKTIIPAGFCTFNVLFSPSSPGSFSDSFDIPNNDPDEDPVTITVSGTGTALPVPDITVNDSVSPADDFQMQFADLTVGISLSGVVRITNNGNANLEIYDIALNDSLTAPFNILNDNCSNKSIIPLSSCTFIVSFSPTSSGVFSDTFDIPSNDVDKDPATVTVHGAGLSSVDNTPPPVPQLIYPEDGQAGLGSSVEFRWMRNADPDLDAVNYYLFVSGDPDFINETPLLVASLGHGNIHYTETGAGILIFGAALAGGVRSKRKTAALIVMLIAVAMLSVSCGGGGGGGNGTTPSPNNEVSMEVSGLTSGATYYWRVVADDGHGGVVQSGERSFTTQ